MIELLTATATMVGFMVMGLIIVVFLIYSIFGTIEQWSTKRYLEWLHGYYRDYYAERIYELFGELKEENKGD